MAALPGLPSDFRCEVAEACADTVSLEITWAAPSEESGSVSHHLVEVHNTDQIVAGAAAFRMVVPHPQTAVLLSSVPRGRHYSVMLAAVGPSGEGPRATIGLTVPAEVSASEATTISTPTARRIPDAPHDLRAVETAPPANTETIDRNTSAMVRVSWSAPIGWAGTEDEAICEYAVAVCSGGVRASTSPSSSRRQPLLATRVPAPSTEILLSGFVRGSQYSVAVRAVSAHGESPEVLTHVVLDPTWTTAEPIMEEGSRQLSEAQSAFCESVRRRWSDSTAVRLVLRLRRPSVFEDSVAILGTAGAARQYLQAHRLRVEFEGEAGYDEGGLLREWLSLVVREGCREERGCFERLDEGGYIWPSAIGWQVDPEEAATVARFVGRMVGVALLSGQCAGFRIHPIFWQWAFPRESESEEVDYFLALRYFDPEQFLQRARLVYTRPQLAAALGLSLDALDVRLPDWRPLDEAEVKALELTWHYETEVCGVPTSLSLRGDRPGSVDEAQAVEQADVPEFLRAWARHRIAGSVEPQLKAVRDGMLEVVPEVRSARLAPAELEELVAGIGWSVEDLLPHLSVVIVREATLSGSGVGTNDLVRWVAEVLRGLTRVQREAFLRYVTGSPRLPAGGAAALRPKMTLQVIPGWSTDALPVAHTCANLLDLPLYTDLEMLRTRLLIALRYVDEGFGLT
eukprot:gnl/TRDRNA2_/TRDRNA2_92512_c0_seq1.p1 gnl/TRDRNA2_/TRDRNA2_92512_c0~~gnl/TRDRNA2_/TRDRNA2_92512_c0_seq1.p1  ORF type:complete len:692 (+),score=115.70 gnl/TRDRNA2_/TRDRNA2_92512_c0_seq1:23-2077(+)